MTLHFRPRLLCLGAALATVLLIVVPARPAWAHASLLSALPADGVTIFDPPKTFRLEFNEPVSPLVMRLVRPDSEIVPLTNVSATNNAVTITAPPMPLQGTYVLSWRVISTDGHPVGGVVSFSIGHPTSGVIAPRPVGATAVHIALWLTQFILAVGLFVGAGGAAFSAWLAEGPLRGKKVFIALMIGAFIAAVASLPLQGLDALAKPLADAFQPSVWVQGYETSWGSTVILALATLVAAFLSLTLEIRFLARALSAAAIAEIGFAFAASGHASATAPRFLTAPTVFFHIVCIALWIGSLLPLTLAVRAGDRAALDRFSRLIPGPLFLLVATGIVLSIVELDRPDALWTTNYGIVLSAKLAIVLVLLVLAALNRYALMPRLEPTGTRRLVQVIATEFVLALTILGVVGLWRFTAPPRALAAAETTYIHFHSERAMAQIDLRPVRDRGASLSIAITDDDLKPVAVKEIDLVIWNPTAGIEPIRRSAVFVGGSQWRVSGLHIPVAGVWRMRVEILIGDFDKVMLEDNVELPRAP